MLTCGRVQLPAVSPCSHTSFPLGSSEGLQGLFASLPCEALVSHQQEGNVPMPFSLKCLNLRDAFRRGWILSCLKAVFGLVAFTEPHQQGLVRALRGGGCPLLPGCWTW